MNKNMKKYWIITYGCQMNKNDSERIATLLEDKGYQPANNENQTDLIVFNICSVRQSAVDRAYNKIKKLSELRTRSASQKLKIIITGCILEKDKKRFAKYGEVTKFSNLFKTKPTLKYSEGFIPIMEGCNNFCTYCIVPYTKGREQYRKEIEIINEAKELIKKGYRKLILLGQNVNSYPDFSKLLKKINNLSGDFELTFLTSHPKDFSNELIEVMAKSKKIIRELHLPVQSGDDEILKKMNRPYTINQYKDMIKRIQKRIPDIKLSTDIIVGFPGETKKQFNNTIKLFKEIKFNSAYISKYSPRPGTPSFKMKDNVPLEEKKQREKILRNLLANTK